MHTMDSRHASFRERNAVEEGTRKMHEKRRLEALENDNFGFLAGTLKLDSGTDPFQQLLNASGTNNLIAESSASNDATISRQGKLPYG
jgi:hypothetical protein